ncbi:hypothetical protein [Ferrimonas sp. YFM]|uniref:hypothetical protein n=1 Tax=Ferrimonas sp. YFM TaxID=3028878 RepID=UPI0025738DD3|nr:hypothetical protein [Ferrimonas sp. YFM]BDY05510.1 hypothetical protein F0521_25510 [Ferrimonas sp. YFM]
MELSLNDLGLALFALTAFNSALILYLLVRQSAMKVMQQQLTQETETRIGESATEVASLITKCATQVQERNFTAWEELRTSLNNHAKAAEENHSKLTQTLISVAGEHRGHNESLLEHLLSAVQQARINTKTEMEKLSDQVAALPSDLQPLMQAERESIEAGLLKVSDLQQESLQNLGAKVDTGLDKLLSQGQALTSKLEQVARQQRLAAHQERLALVEQLSERVQSLKISNAVDLTNALMEGRDLKVETEEFVKHLGECKVTAMEDKLSGQVTEILYEEGRKVASRTFEDGQLKYQIQFDEQGRAVKGEEYSSDGEVAFEYRYDLAGEVSSRQDHTATVQ